jgi:hypothetical protein
MRVLLATVLGFALTGCATIASHPSEMITITSEPGGADAALDCGSGKQVLVTPAQFIVARQSSDCMLTIQKSGFAQETVLLERGINRWVWANLPLGILGVGVLGMSGFSDDGAAEAGGAMILVGLGGLAIDALTGRFHDHDPKKVHVTLRASP